MTSLTPADIIETLGVLAAPAALLAPTDDGEFIVKSANKPALDMLRPALGDPVGQRVTSIPFRTNTGTVLQSIAEQVLQEGSSKVVETSIARVDGSRLDLSTTWAPIFDGDTMIAIVLTVTDISELVALRMQRAQELSLFASGFIKTCAWCGRVRDKEQWRSASDYVADHPARSELVTCPDCA